MPSVPGRNEGGAARYGTISGSSAAAAVVAGAAALLAEARPDLDAAGLRGALVADARGVGGTVAPASSIPPPPRRVELVADPPVAALGALIDARRTTTGSITLRNVSRRPSSSRCGRGRTRRASRSGRSRSRVVLRPGGRADVVR